MKKMSFLICIVAICNFSVFSQSVWTEMTIGTNPYLSSVYFIDDSTGYAVGQGIFKTTDAGSNWISQSSGTSNNLLSVFFTDADTGYAVGWFGTILKTSNASIDWIEQTS